MSLINHIDQSLKWNGWIKIAKLQSYQFLTFTDNSINKIEKFKKLHLIIAEVFKAKISKLQALINNFHL